MIQLLNIEYQKHNTDLILILIPVFNDWLSLKKLLTNLDEVFNYQRIKCDFLVVDDAFTIAAHDNFMSENFKAIIKVNCLKLKRYLAHQKAITVGLA